MKLSMILFFIPKVEGVYQEIKIRGNIVGRFFRLYGYIIYWDDDFMSFKVNNK